MAGREDDEPFDDLIFSINIDLPFETPEMFFDGEIIDFEIVNGVKV